MTAKPAPNGPDDLLTFCPGIQGEEYQLRANMRSFRNTAAAMITGTESGTARQIAWIVTDYSTELLYAPISNAALADLNKFFNRLLLTAMQAERIDLLGPGT